MKMIKRIGLSSLVFFNTSVFAFGLSDAVNTLDAVNAVVDKVKNTQEQTKQQTIEPVQQVESEKESVKETVSEPPSDKDIEYEFNRMDIKRVKLLQKEFYGAWSENCKYPSSDDSTMRIDQNGIAGYESHTDINEAKWITKGKVLEVMAINCDEQGCDVEKEIWTLSNGNNTLVINGSSFTSKWTRCHHKK